MSDWIEEDRRLTEGELCPHGIPTPGFESSSQGVKMRLVVSCTGDDHGISLDLAIRGGPRSSVGRHASQGQEGDEEDTV